MERELTVGSNHRQSPENLQLVIHLGDLLRRMEKKGETTEVYGKEWPDTSLENPRRKFHL
jgi:hypothetical protein